MGVRPTHFTNRFFSLFFGILHLVVYTFRQSEFLGWFPLIQAYIVILFLPELLPNKLLIQNNGFWYFFHSTLSF